MFLKIYKPIDGVKKIKFYNELFGYALGLIIVGGPLYLYFKMNDGSESIFLMLISGIFFILYGSTKMSPIAGGAYKDYDFKLFTTKPCDE